MINEVLPKREVIEVIIKDIIIPILKQLEVDLGKHIYKCSVYIGENEVFSKTIDSEGCECFCENAQPIRIRFRTIFQPHKLRFHVEGVFSESISPKGTGFSGFNTGGSINVEDLSIKKSPWTVRYNVWDWKGWEF
ncbi:hypothetical protein [Acetivibrio clariflavus]|uniref:hypothetical protein n=1 Tax=Acetivibrio clariflavus TaxID=288965 RepID=UPI00047FFA7F|nr:hypothetical protein [Acetivibrio clariflavus]